jgi:hypothetical protein
MWLTYEHNMTIDYQINIFYNEILYIFPCLKDMYKISRSTRVSLQKSGEIPLHLGKMLAPKREADLLRRKNQHRLVMNILLHRIR